MVSLRVQIAEIAAAQHNTRLVSVSHGSFNPTQVVFRQRGKIRDAIQYQLRHSEYSLSESVVKVFHPMFDGAGGGRMEMKKNGNELIL